MGGASPAAFKEMKRVLKFVLDTKGYGLKVEPRKPSKNGALWTLEMFSDSDWAGDKDSRRSVSGFILFLMGVPIMWRSRAQKSVALSSSESEFYAMAESVKEIKFVVQVLESMGIEMELPVVVRVDNVGAIFMAENETSSSARTRHIDIRWKFVKEFVEDGFVKIVFVPTAENVSDGFTKNTSSEIYDSHLGYYVGDEASIDG
jgi:hypothetical protein